ncbi:hypothetical protein [Pseudoponticoccus marisrubri]|uniref:DUF304 domain-containing protein n=1 Tax=Pseudoponticoccus marisrubri TaxID=1685382 RepID=A0A0W7WGG7_9RHOB|nr:hypothetical protein [Pseudoponticoccus marisrubri]KUF09739.1 hypothetical protein AVJ23_16435 [Pseudoponticoccus marisrubri]
MSGAGRDVGGAILFRPDRQTYLRTHAIMAALAMAGGMVVLWLLGNPHVWAGAIGGLGAVAFRGWFLMSEELAHVWTLTGDRLEGPGERLVPLARIDRLRAIGAAVQVITQDGDKHLIKFQADPQATIARIEARRQNG